MIDYVEIREPVNRQLIGICDVVESIIWQPVYFGVGEFEVYAEANAKNLDLLKIGNYVTRIDDVNCGIIKSIEITFDEQKGRMIAASGKFAKCILGQRVVYCTKWQNTQFERIDTMLLLGNVADACWELIQYTCGEKAPANRRLNKFGRGTINDLPAIIRNENGEATVKTPLYDNLQEYTDALLQGAGYGAYVWLDTFSGELLYVMYNGADRSRGNTEGNTPVVFSRDYDTLISSTYTESIDTYKTTPVISGVTIEANNYQYRVVANDTAAGYDRYEVYVDASNIQRTKTASELQVVYPTGRFYKEYYVVPMGIIDGVVAVLAIPDTEKDKEYELKDLQKNFPTGSVSGTKYSVGGVTYANRVYGDDEKYTLTPLGYMGLLAVEEKEAEYTLYDDAYKNLLVTHGTEKLLDHRVEKKFTGVIDTTSSRYVYGRDYFVGDIVTVEDAEIGIETKCRILKVTETLSTSGYSITAEYETV